MQIVTAHALKLTEGCYKIINKNRKVQRRVLIINKIIKIIKHGSTAVNESAPARRAKIIRTEMWIECG